MSLTNENIRNTTLRIFSWSNTTSLSSSRHGLMSDFSITISRWTIYTFLCQGIDIFGIVTNIINIICFVKQGFKDPVNVSLFGLAVSDLGCLVPLVWTNICLTPAFGTSGFNFDPIEFQYLTGAWPHITFTRISSWITALITMERCLCITVPLQIKNIVTSKRVAIITGCVFTILIFSMAPIYVVNALGMKYFPERNKSLIGLVFTENRVSVEKVSFVINNVFVPFSAFIIIIACTITLVIKLKTTSTWRKRSTNVTKADSVSLKNQKVAKMVVMISTLFIACFVTLSIIFIAMTFEPDISLNGRYRNVALFLGGLGFVLESINSSVNIFIYYHMSSRFKATFRQLFCSDMDNRKS